MKTPMVFQIVLTGVVFAALWLLWSGHYTPLLLALGAGSCAATTWLALRVGFIGVGTYTSRRLAALLPFWAWLLKEIVVSNLAVARTVLTPRLRIAPQVVRIDASALSDVGQVIFANAVTLTPGTLTVDVDAGVIEVHCLTHEAAEALRGGAMLHRVAALD